MLGWIQAAMQQNTTDVLIEDAVIICTVFNIVRHLATAFVKRHREEKATQQRNKRRKPWQKGWWWFSIAVFLHTFFLCSHPPPFFVYILLWKCNLTNFFSGSVQKQRLRMNPRSFGIVLVFFFHFLKITQTSEAEDFNPLDHITAGKGIHFNQDEVSVDEGEPSVHLDERCRCTCPPFDVPEVARMGGKIYTGQVRYILRDANSLN
jgi:hypothetical protein